MPNNGNHMEMQESIGQEVYQYFKVVLDWLKVISSVVQTVQVLD